MPRPLAAISSIAARGPVGLPADRTYSASATSAARSGAVPSSTNPRNSRRRNGRRTRLMCALFLAQRHVLVASAAASTIDTE